MIGMDHGISTTNNLQDCSLSIESIPFFWRAPCRTERFVQRFFPMMPEQRQLEINHSKKPLVHFEAADFGQLIFQPRLPKMKDNFSVPSTSREVFQPSLFYILHPVPLIEHSCLRPHMV